MIALPVFAYRHLGVASPRIRIAVLFLGALMAGLSNNLSKLEDLLIEALVDPLSDCVDHSFGNLMRNFVLGVEELTERTQLVLKLWWLMKI